MRVTVRRGAGDWVVRVAPSEGPALLYRFRSRNQARFYAAVFRMGPPAFPPGYLAH